MGLRIGATVDGTPSMAFLQGGRREAGPEAECRGGGRVSAASGSGLPPWSRSLSRSGSTSSSPPDRGPSTASAGNQHHSHRGARSRKRSGRERVRGEPRAAGWKHHRHLPGSAGAQRQAASVPEGTLRNSTRGRAGEPGIGEPQLRAPETAGPMIGLTLTRSPSGAPRRSGRPWNAPLARGPRRWWCSHPHCSGPIAHTSWS